MNVELTGHQVRIVNLCERSFRRQLPYSHLRICPMYRHSGFSMSIGLACTDGDQHFIVRETVRWYATRNAIVGSTSRLILLLAHQYAKFTGGKPLFVGTHHGE